MKTIFRSRSLRVVCRLTSPVIAMSGVLITLLINPHAASADTLSLNKRFSEGVAPFLNKHCLACHGTKTQEAKLDLSGFKSIESVAKAHQIWEIVLERLKANEMPPKDAKPQPSKEERTAVVQWIQDVRRFEAERNAGDPGPVLARRLSNAEYNYTIRDLTGVDIQPTKTFPVDPANEAGFDNSGESLTMSPALLQKYLGAARQVVEHLVLTPTGVAWAPHPVMTDTDRDKYCVKRIVQFYQGQPTELILYFYAAWEYRNRDALGMPNASLKDIAKNVRQGPISSKYLRTVWSFLTDNDPKTSVGPVAMVQSRWQALPDDVLKRQEVLNASLHLADDVRQLRYKLRSKFPNLSVEGSHVGSQPFVLWKNRQYVNHRRKYNPDALQVRVDASDDDNDAEAKSRNPLAEVFVVPADKDERTRFDAAFARFASVFPDAFYVSERGRDYVERSKKQMGERGRLLSAGFHSMMGYFRDDKPLYDLILDENGQKELDELWDELNVVTQAPQRQYVGFLWFERTDSRYMRDPQFDFARPEKKEAQSEKLINELSRLYLEKAVQGNAGERELGAIRHYFREINNQIREVKFVRRKAEPHHVEGALDFAQKAYRRKLSADERNELVEFYDQLRNEDGVAHEEAIRDVFVSILMSPHFCFRLDIGRAVEGSRPLTDNELANRLSYFLWSSLPDEKLLAKAEAGQLRDPATLVAQAQRLLKDKRVRGLAVEFAGNWLDFRRFEEHNSVDRTRFPQFTDELRQAMFEEPVRFFVDVAQHDRSVLSLLTAEHTFVNAPLAKHYGIPLKVARIPQTRTALAADGGGWQADPRIWKRVNTATDFGRGGLLPMSVFLTKNAPGLRTSPVKRGYWVVRRLLGEQIPPPPPNVPELPEDESKFGELTLRQVLAKHRDHKSCAGCHERFDSIGLIFEGFGPIGERREKDLGGRPVETTATFPGAGQGNGVDGLREYLQQHRQEEYLDNICRKLLSYSLGRTLLLSDDLLIEEMLRRLADDDYRFGSLIETIVTSRQFLHKRGRDRLAQE